VHIGVDGSPFRLQVEFARGRCARHEVFQDLFHDLVDALSCGRGTRRGISSVPNTDSRPNG
jgi:hypothetical protein